ncbi:MULTISPECIES: questin oxidase family protein [Streptomyces]|uniref:questin oxidase family protein n=1 Tax=Streptomyces TaxID=1883 RepID=UPI0002F4E4F1|nr:MULTISPECIES: questin oxidase family protein [Streptomyces]
MNRTTITDSPVVERLLDDRTHYIEFNSDPGLTGPAFPTDRLLPSAKHLSNHAKHAVVALAGLGAPAETIEAYYRDYTTLTPYGYPLEPARASRGTITEENWQRWIGARSHYADYCAFFDRRERELGLDTLLRTYLPALLPGWVGAFTHATIHLGWALDAGNRWMTIEGLAYLAFSAVSCHPERATPAADLRDQHPVDSLLRIAGEWERDRDGLRTWAETLIADTSPAASAGIHPELAGLQYRIARVLGEGHPLIDRTPPWTEEGPGAAWDRLYYAVTLLYLAMPGDFIALHLITSLHAMEQIAGRLPADRQREAVRSYWRGILCVLFSRAEFPARTELAALHARYAGSFDDGTDPAHAAEWERTIARAIGQIEEHNPKLVYVLRRVWHRTGHHTIYRAAAGHFTPTPEALKSA